ncbi:hypothetical protein ACQV26_02555 [Mycobacterium sp. Lab-001]
MADVVAGAAMPVGELSVVDDSDVDLLLEHAEKPTTAIVARHAAATVLA